MLSQKKLALFCDTCPLVPEYKTDPLVILEIAKFVVVAFVNRELTAVKKAV